MTDIIFCKRKYTMESAKLLAANNKIISHLASIETQDGITLDFNGISHNLETDRLDTAKAKLIRHLNNRPAGTNKVIIDDFYAVGNLDDAISNIITLLVEKAGNTGIDITAVLGKAILGAMMLGVADGSNISTTSSLGVATLGTLILGDIRKEL